MQDNTITDVLAVPVEQQQAMELHLRIKANLEMTAAALVEVCRGLKEMKEADQYRALGFGSFEEYTESALGIKSRMAYYYISTYDRLGPDLLADNAGLGITKLRLLAEVTPFDRNEFLEDNDLAGMTTAEIRAAVQERNGLREQLSMLEDATGPAVPPEDDRPTDEEIEQRIEAAVDARLAAEKEQAAQAARAEAEAEQARLVKAAKKEAREKAERDAEKKLAEARAAAAEEGRAAAKREMDAQLERERAEKEAAAARAAALEKKLNVSASTETTAFALHFDQMQQHFIKMAELIEKVREKGDADEADKLAAVLVQGMESLRMQLPGQTA